MRKKVVIGNWKMNGSLNNSIKLAKAVSAGAAKRKRSKLSCEVGIAPNFTAISSLKKITGKSILLGAQNVHYAESGAFTGEVSIEMLLSVGCNFAILGHSERRLSPIDESNDFLNKKVLASIKKLRVVYCVGEQFKERRSGKMKTVVKSQLVQGLKGMSQSDAANLIIAYEPVWAIGTGKVATPEQAEEMHKFIRTVLADIFSNSAAEKIVILYGGSVKSSNADAILSMPNIDGALVGGASLDAKEFLKIVEAADKTTDTKAKK